MESPYVLTVGPPTIQLNVGAETDIQSIGHDPEYSQPSTFGHRNTQPIEADP